MKVWIVSVGYAEEGESPVAVYDSAAKAKARVDELKMVRKSRRYFVHDYETYQEYEVQ